MREVGEGGQGEEEEGEKKKKAHRHQLFHLDESLNTAMESLSIYSFTVHWVPAAKKKKMYSLQAQLLSL